MRLIRWYTVETSSDHRALICVYKVDGARFRVGTWNIGDRGTQDDLHKITRLCDVLVLNEVGDRNLELLLPEGWGYRSRSRVALAWDWDYPPDMREDVLLSSRMWGGEGAGPSWVKRKHLVTGRFPVGSRKVWVAGLHLVASQWNPLRWAIGKLQVRRTAGWAAKKWTEVVVAGDFNNVPESKMFRALRRIGMRRVRSGPTHGRRAIDHQWVT